MHSPTLLVLAAGMGSRYGGLKQIEPVGPNGETIIDFSIFDAKRAGFRRVVFVIRKEIEHAFRETVGIRYENQIEVDYVFQELDKLPTGFAVPSERTKPWGTGHAILMGAETIKEPFAVINGDDFYGQNSFSILGRHLSEANPTSAMVAFVLSNTLSEFGAVARGVCQTTKDDFLQTIIERTRIERTEAGVFYTDQQGIQHSLQGNEPVSLNMWGFTPSIFDHLQHQFVSFLQENAKNSKAEFFIPSVVDALITRGNEKVKVLRTPDNWLGVTYREDRPRVAAGISDLVARGQYPTPLWV